MNKQSNSNVMSGIFWKFGERIFAQLVSFVVSVVLARLIAPEEYGVVSLVLIFITIADVFVVSGFSTSLIQKREADETDFSTIFFCSLACSVLIYFVLFLSAPAVAELYGNEDIILILRVFALRIPISAYNSVQHAYVSRNMLFKKFFFSTLVGTILSGIVGIFLALHDFGVWALVVQYLTNTIVDTIVLSMTVRWYPKMLFSFESAKQLMSYGWKILCADLIGTFCEQLRGLLIGKVYTSSDLAFYNKGQQIPNMVASNISSSVMSVLFPAISNINGEMQTVKNVTRKAVHMMSYVIFPSMAGLIVVSEPLIFLLLGEKWGNSVIFMQLMCVFSAVSLIGNVSLQTIKAIGRSDVILKLEVVKKPVYILLLLAGVYLGVKEIAVTMVLYGVYGTLINAYQLKKYIGYGWKEQFADISIPFLLSIVMMCLTGMLKIVIKNKAVLLGIQVIAGGTFYIMVSEVLQVKAYIFIKQIILEKLRRK